jgi:hypothetical protein
MAERRPVTTWPGRHDWPAGLQGRGPLRVGGGSPRPSKGGGRTAGRRSPPCAMWLVSLMAVHTLALSCARLRAFNGPNTPVHTELAAAWCLVADALGEGLIRFLDCEQCRGPTMDQPRG